MVPVANIDMPWAKELSSLWSLAELVKIEKLACHVTQVSSWIFSSINRNLARIVQSLVRRSAGDRFGQLLHQIKIKTRYHFSFLMRIHSVFFIRDVGNFQLVVSLKFSPNLTHFVSYGVS